MSKTQFFDPKTGRWQDEDSLHGGIIPDGGRMRVTLAMMDTGEDVPEARDAAYDAMVRELDGSTPHKSSQFDTHPQQPSTEELQAAADTAYESYERALTEGTYHMQETTP